MLAMRLVGNSLTGLLYLAVSVSLSCCRLCDTSFKDSVLSETESGKLVVVTDGVRESGPRVATFPYQQVTNSRKNWGKLRELNCD